MPIPSAAFLRAYVYAFVRRAGVKYSAPPAAALRELLEHPFLRRAPDDPRKPFSGWSRERQALWVRRVTLPELVPKSGLAKSTSKELLDYGHTIAKQIRKLANSQAIRLPNFEIVSALTDEEQRWLTKILRSAQGKY